MVKMMSKNFFLLFVLVFFSTQSLKAQLGFSHEIGAIMGPVAFQSDYGVRSDFETNSGNTGFGVGIIHYINFAYRADCNCYTKDTFFNDHFKLRNEISFNKTYLENLGEWVAPEKNSSIARRLRGMSAEANVFDLGSQIEFFPYSIRDFAAGGYSFAPFFSLGAHFNIFSPKSAQDNSQITQLEFEQTSNIDPNVSIGGVSGMENNAIFLNENSTNESFSSWSIVWSIGTRYKLTPLSDLMIDLRWQYYFTDMADGLNHNAPSDKFNDWNAWLNFGYIYYLD
tara:strand:- start:20 stop:865 length:846 start_codon:yes stop_codon:yes gene_type:complete